MGRNEFEVECYSESETQKERENFDWCFPGPLSPIIGMGLFVSLKKTFFWENLGRWSVLKLQANLISIWWNIYGSKHLLTLGLFARVLVGCREEWEDKEDRVLALLIVVWPTFILSCTHVLSSRAPSGLRMGNRQAVCLLPVLNEAPPTPACTERESCAVRTEN